MVTPRRRTISQISDMVYDIHNFGVFVDTREIFLTTSLEEHLENAMIDHTVATTFVKNMALLNSANDKPILIHMITNGGDWNYGMAIYDAIYHSPAHVTVLAYAHARSMSSIIPQAADLRIMMPNAEFLIHHGEMAVDGTFTTAKYEVAWADECDKRMVQIYAEKCINGPYFKKKNATLKVVTNWLEKQMAYKEQVYFSPQDAVQYGFMDGILGSPEFPTIDSLRCP